jgi:hypothetical protein
MKPNAAIRRFDVFVEYNRLKAMKDGMRAAQAKGYALWLAKIVAARRGMPKPKPEETGKGKGEEKYKKSKWRELSGKPQTDRLFEKEIVTRMGASFYKGVFVPAIRKAFEDGEDYRDIRDSIREDWQPDLG